MPIKSKYKNMKRLLEEEKMSFKNRKTAQMLRVKKTGNTKDFCPNQV